jgi:hypothetical protein
MAVAALSNQTAVASWQTVWQTVQSVCQTNVAVTGEEFSFSFQRCFHLDMKMPDDTTQRFGLQSSSARW